MGTYFKDRKQQKQLLYERQVLGEISYEQIKKKAHQYFSHFFLLPTMEEYCVMLGIEAYLLGASYCKFYHMGETMEEIRKRCCHKSLMEELYFLFIREGFVDCEPLYKSCTEYIDNWWSEGILRGERRLRLRL